MGKIEKCPDCNRYTVESICPACSTETEDPGPPAYSPEDPHGDERRATKRAARED